MQGYEFITILIGSFLGSLVSMLVGISLVLAGKYKAFPHSEVENVEEVVKREPPKGIGMYADPLEKYNRYQDYDSKLYNPINDTKGEIKVDRQV